MYFCELNKHGVIPMFLIQVRLLFSDTLQPYNSDTVI